jgi:hypothetical protein
MTGTKRGRRYRMRYSYTITEQVTARITVEVEADSEQEAIELGQEEAFSRNIAEWDTLEEEILSQEIEQIGEGE